MEALFEYPKLNSRQSLKAGGVMVRLTIRWRGGWHEAIVALLLRGGSTQEVRRRAATVSALAVASTGMGCRMEW